MQQADRHRDQHGDERSHDGAVNRRDGAEFFGHRVPVRVGQERETERVQRRPGAVNERDDDAGQDDEHRDGGGAPKVGESVIRSTGEADRWGCEILLSEGEPLPSAQTKEVGPPGCSSAVVRWGRRVLESRMAWHHLLTHGERAEEMIRCFDKPATLRNKIAGLPGMAPATALDLCYCHCEQRGGVHPTPWPGG